MTKAVRVKIYGDLQGGWTPGIIEAEQTPMWGKSISRPISRPWPKRFVFSVGSK